MHSFEVHSNESVYRKNGRLGLEQVITPQPLWGQPIYDPGLSLSL